MHIEDAFQVVYDEGVVDDVNVAWWTNREEPYEFYTDGNIVVNFNNSKYSRKNFESVRLWYTGIKKFQNIGRIAMALLAASARAFPFIGEKKYSEIELFINDHNISFRKDFSDTEHSIKSICSALYTINNPYFASKSVEKISIGALYSSFRHKFGYNHSKIISELSDSFGKEEERIELIYSDMEKALSPQLLPLVTDPLYLP